MSIFCLSKESLARGVHALSALVAGAPMPQLTGFCFCFLIHYMHRKEYENNRIIIIIKEFY